MPDAAKAGSVWTVDPLADDERIYQLRFEQYADKVLVFDSFAQFKKSVSVDVITLPIAAADAKFVVWDENIYYLASAAKKLIKFCYVTVL